MTRQHLLITGAPHSGTTLLADLVGRHPEIVVFVAAKRFDFNRVVGKAVVGNTLCLPDDIDFKAKRQEGAVFYSVRPLEGYLKLSSLRVILSLHDGSGVIAAMRREENKSFAAAARRWCRAVTVMHELKQQLQQNALVISMTRLFTDPKSTMHQVATFLGLEYHAKMLDDWQETLAAAEADLAPATPDGDLENLYPESWQKYLALSAAAARAAEGGN